MIKICTGTGTGSSFDEFLLFSFCSESEWIQPFCRFSNNICSKSAVLWSQSNFDPAPDYKIFVTQI